MAGRPTTLSGMAIVPGQQQQEWAEWQSSFSEAKVSGSGTATTLPISAEEGAKAEERRIPLGFRASCARPKRLSDMSVR
jgi:hypothetical protein